ncbi:hypothetical protein [Helicobacter sp. MIT 05-5294]|uniref:hypothetical protein n=1 Tax=Helicobacter sp. MIT 05-5294 TaxID=1548150 RepID=UPI00051FC0EE|nr:hypothetical protein [Helicobacter sp. MIT 05-5294]TLD87264.1 hypothetical protein LS69_004395 [Helicobacter sp. MIT 05-5294]
MNRIKYSLIFIVCLTLGCGCSDSKKPNEREKIELDAKQSKTQNIDVDTIMLYGKFGLKAAMKINKELSGKWNLIKEKTAKDSTFPLSLAHKLVICVAYDAMGRDVVLDFDNLEVVRRDGGELEPITMRELAEFEALNKPIMALINDVVLNKSKR